MGIPSEDAATLSSCHHPRKRMIQYAATSQFNLEGHGVLDTRFRGYDD
jgi:hypothetical protein